MVQPAIEVKQLVKAKRQFIDNLDNHNRKNFWAAACPKCSQQANHDGKIGEADEQSLKQFKTLKFVNNKKVVHWRSGDKIVHSLMLDFQCPIGHSFSHELSPVEIKQNYDILTKTLKLNPDQLKLDFDILADRK